MLSSPSAGASARLRPWSSTAPLVLVGLLGLSFANGCDRPSDDAASGAATSDTEAAAVPISDDGVEATAAEIADEGLVGPPEPAEPDFTPVERIVVTGATVLSDLHLDESGEWVALGLEDTTVVIEDGVVTRLVPSSNYQLGPGDVAVTARGRWVMSAPILVGTSDDVDGLDRWLEGGRLVDATLTGIGSIILPEEIADGPHGRCAAARLAEFEIPAASVLGADDETLAALDGVPTLDGGLRPADALAGAIQEALDDGRSPIEVLAMLTTAPSAALGRPSLGAVEPGSAVKVLVLDENPLENPMSILRPHAVTFGDRVMRRAEIEVLRDASARGADMRTTVLGLSAPDVATLANRRWTLSVQAQVFGGMVAGPTDDGLHFTGRTGQPRFDATTGVLRLDAPEGVPNLELDYDGPPQSFEISTTSGPDGLGVSLSVEDGEPISGESPGPNGPPIVDLAVDLDLRREMLAAAEAFELDLQELIYGSGPIGLAPRRYRFTPIDPDSCPPCFEVFERVWRIEVIDLEREGEVAAIATVGMRAGRPARARFDAGSEPVWFDEIPAVDRPSID